MNVRTSSLDWPMNFIYGIFGRTEDIDPAFPPTDLIGSAEYVINCLSKKYEVDIIINRYKYKITQAELAKEFNVSNERIRQIELTAMRKLRHPRYTRFLKYGVLGVIEQEKESVLKKFNINVPHINDEISSLGLSISTCRFLMRDGIFTIKDLIERDASNGLSKIRNIGIKRLNEIHECLKKYQEENSSLFSDKFQELFDMIFGTDSAADSCDTDDE